MQPADCGGAEFICEAAIQSPLQSPSGAHAKGREVHAGISSNLHRFLSGLSATPCNCQYHITLVKSDRIIALFRIVTSFII